MTRLAAMLVLTPAAALAHAGAEGHSHPHGLEGLILAAVVLAGIWAVRRAMR